MKLVRPYIPLSVRLEVALRQLFGDEPFHLDHDPALCNRTIGYGPNGEVYYEPAANDPDFLIYRNAESHRVKTFIKGEGARRSDMGQRRYLKRVIARRNPKPRFKPRAAKHIRRTPHAPVTTKNGDQVE